MGQMAVFVGGYRNLLAWQRKARAKMDETEGRIEMVELMLTPAVSESSWGHLRAQPPIMGHQEVEFSDLTFTLGPRPPPCEEQRHEVQLTTRAKAGNHGQPWTGADFAVIEQEPNDEKVALLLGRSLAAVTTMRSKLKQGMTTESQHLSAWNGPVAVHPAMR